MEAVTCQPTGDAWIMRFAPVKIVGNIFPGSLPLI